MKTNRIGLAATCAFVLALLAFAAPAIAQSGQLKGKVVDAQNKPVADAKIVMEATETIAQGRDQVERQRGVHPDRPAAWELQGHGDEG